MIYFTMSYILYIIYYFLLCKTQSICYVLCIIYFYIYIYILYMFYCEFSSLCKMLYEFI